MQTLKHQAPSWSTPTSEPSSMCGPSQPFLHTRSSSCCSCCQRWTDKYVTSFKSVVMQHTLIDHRIRNQKIIKQYFGLSRGDNFRPLLCMFFNSFFFLCLMRGEYCSKNYFCHFLTQTQRNHYPKNLHIIDSTTDYPCNHLAAVWHMNHTRVSFILGEAHFSHTRCQIQACFDIFRVNAALF